MTVSFEKGGRSDKLGNRYEGRWVVKQLLALINEEIKSVIIEAIGDEEQGVDLWIKKKNDDSRECHQCKARNGSNESWSVAFLKQREVLDNIKIQLDNASAVTYIFVSAVSFIKLHDLCFRAKNNCGNEEAFYKHQIITSPDTNKIFTDFLKGLQLDVSSKRDLLLAMSYLQRINVVNYPDDMGTKLDLLETIKRLFIGDAESIYSLLADFAVENDYLGKEITANTLINHLLNHGYTLRNLSRDERILPRLLELNHDFEAYFSPIQDTFIARCEIEKCVTHILDGKSVILHGDAGYGKSGCVLGVMRTLQEQNIPVLAIKLDRRIPKDTAQKYGESLGLPASPVHCLNAISKKHGVLILDQLDAIRWTSLHNRAAIDVCRELIREAKNINLGEEISISIILVCRTFDYNNDSTIKSLFHKDNPHEDIWKEIKVVQFDEDIVKKITDPYYVNFSSKLKQLLRVPNNLFIWSKLDDNHKSLSFASTVDLIRELWNQLCEQCQQHSISHTEINGLKLALVDKITQTKEQSIPDFLLSAYSPSVISFAVSQGILLRIGNATGFTHQSFYDYFLVEKLLSDYYEKNRSIEEILGPMSEQTPTRRYQLQMFLQILLDTNAESFLQCGKTILDSLHVRIHLKFVFLELLGQVEMLIPSMQTLTHEYMANPEWSSHFINTVILGRPGFVKYLIENGTMGTWLSDDRRAAALQLLKSTHNVLQDEIVELLRPMVFQSEALDLEIFSTLCWKIEDDFDNMFELRMELMSRYPSIWTHYYDLISLAKANVQRTVWMLTYCLTQTEKRADTHMNGMNENNLKEFDEIATSNPFLIWETFMPLVNDQTKNTDWYYGGALAGYRSYDVYNEEDLGRILVRLLKISAKKLIEYNSHYFLEKCVPYFSSDSYVVNEILLSSFELLPVEHSNFVLDWLMADSPVHLFCQTGVYEEELYPAKQLIARFSLYCGDDMFNKLESFIYYYHEQNELRYAKDRFSAHKETKESDRRLFYWPYWGEVQTYLLPVLDSTRTSDKSKQLIGVLNRRFSGYYYHHIRHRGHSGEVASSISGTAEQFSDKRWIQVITDPKVKSASAKHHWKEVKGGFLETAPHLFAQTFAQISMRNPTHYAELAVQLPETIDPSYICAIYDLSSKTTNDKAESSEWEPVDITLVQKLISKFGSGDTRPSIARSFCEIIRNRPEEKWDKGIIDKVIKIALYYDESQSEELIHRPEKDTQDEEETYERLTGKWFNTVRGAAVDALSQLLLSDADRCEIFVPVIKELVADSVAVVETPIIKLIGAVYNTDRDLALQWLDELLSLDIRIAGHNFAHSMIVRSFMKAPSKYAGIILTLYHSTDEYLIECGAAILTHIYFLYTYPPFESILMGKDGKTDKQLKGISHVASYFLKESQHREKAKQVLEALLSYPGEWAHFYSQLFYQNSLDITEDADLIKKILLVKPHMVFHSFGEYIQTTGCNLSEYAHVLLKICENLSEIVEEDKKLGNYYGLMSELPILISQLFDCTIDNPDTNQKCLDMWDMLFKNQVGATRQLSQSIMEM